MATLSEAKRIVVKIGSALLVEDGRLRADWLASLAEDVAACNARGQDVILVSSGSIPTMAFGFPETGWFTGTSFYPWICPPA